MYIYFHNFFPNILADSYLRNVFRRYNVKIFILISTLDLERVKNMCYDLVLHFLEQKNSFNLQHEVGYSDRKLYLVGVVKSDKSPVFLLIIIIKQNNIEQRETGIFMQYRFLIKLIMYFIIIKIKDRTAVLHFFISFTYMDKHS